MKRRPQRPRGRTTLGGRTVNRPHLLFWVVPGCRARALDGRRRPALVSQSWADFMVSQDSLHGIANVSVEEVPGDRVVAGASDFGAPSPHEDPSPFDFNSDSLWHLL